MPFNVSFIVRLQDKFSKSSQRVARSAEKMKLRVLAAGGATGKLSDKLAKNRRQLAGTRSGLIGVAAAAASVILPVREAIRFETEMANVKKVLREVSPENLATIRDIALDLSKTLPTAPEILLRTAAAGKKIGVALPNLKEFTRLISETSVAIEGINPEEAATVFARFENIFGGGTAAVRDMTDATNELSNRLELTGVELLNAMANRTALVGKQMGLTANQSIALAATLTALGIQGSQVGTTIRRMTLAFKDVEKIGEAGFEAFQVDPQGTLLAVLEQLRDLPEKARIAAAVDLFGERFALNVVTLAQNMGKYTEALDIATNRSVFAGSVQRELANVLATTQANLDLTKNSFKRLGIEIGETQLPLINLLAKSITNINDTFATFANRFPKITGFITSMTIAVIALIAAAFLLKFALAGLAIVGLGVTAVFGATVAGFVGGLASVVAITAGVGLLGVALGGLLATGIGKGLGGIINKFKGMNKEVKKLNEELGVNVNKKVAKGIANVKVMGSSPEAKRLFALNAALSETKLQIRRGGIGVDVDALERSFQKLSLAKDQERFGPFTPALTTPVAVDVKVRLETDEKTNVKSVQSSTDASGNVSVVQTGRNMGGG